MFLNRPVRENLSAAHLLAFVTRKLRGFGFKGEKRHAAKIVDEMNIAVPHVENQIGDLSGGNQQKALLGRWLAMDPQILILDEPTKGVDIGAKFDIHQAIVDLAAQGRSVVIVSSDLPELMHTTHRMLVMRKGRIVGEFDRADYDSVKIISMAASEGKGDST
jgi:ABC-type sugar transport system ATPase subunit